MPASGIWSNGANDVHHGAYTNPYQYTNLTAIDNVEADFCASARKITALPRA